jgi:uncharacterized protein YjbJ (UPF0337 family)
MSTQMTRDQIQGRLLRFVGTLEQGWGWLIDDQTLRARGERDRRLGRMWQAYSAASAPTMQRRDGNEGD